MGEAIDKYYARRQKRLDARYGKKTDSVSDYRERRDRRIQERFDANIRRLYGVAIGMDIPGAEEMEPAELVKALRDRGVNAKGVLRNGAGRYKGGAEVEGKKRGYVDGWTPPSVSGMKRGEVHKLLSGCNKIGRKYYDNGTEVAKMESKPHLWTYTSHGMDHIQQVIDKSNQAADMIEKMPENGVFRGAKIDRSTLLAASWFHDTGMDGGNMDWSGDDGNNLRKAHGLNSAVHVLENADAIRELGVDPNKVAMVVYAHTKSMSGIEDLSSPEQWKIGLANLQKAVEEHNKGNGKKVSFDRSAVFGGEPDDNNIHQMMASVAAIRLGDANREASGPLRSQSGGEYKIEKKPEIGKYGSAKEEAANSVISITEDGKRHELSFEDEKMKNNPGHPYSKMVVLGERNLAKINTGFSKRHQTLQEEVELANGNEVPWSTVEALLERCGELNTINGIPRAIKIKMSGVNSWEEMDAQAKNAYKDMWKRVQKEADKKTGKLKYAGVKNIVLEFEDGSRRASAHDFMPVNNKGANNRGKRNGS